MSLSYFWFKPSQPRRNAIKNRLVTVFVTSLWCHLDSTSAYISLEPAAWDECSKKKSEPSLEQRLLQQSIALIKKLNIQSCLLSPLISGLCICSSLCLNYLLNSLPYLLPVTTQRPSLPILLKLEILPLCWILAHTTYYHLTGCILYLLIFFIVYLPSLEF